MQLFDNFKRNMQRLLSLGGRLIHSLCRITQAVLQSHPARLSSGMKESVTLMVMLFAGLLFVSLLSYRPADSSTIYAAMGIPVNAIGRIGYNTADWLFYVMGSVAYLMPVYMLLWVAQGWVGSNEDQGGSTRRSHKMIGAVGAVLALAPFVDVQYLGESHYPSGDGGILGWSMAEYMLDQVGVLGMHAILVVVMMVSMSLLFSFSWVSAAKRTCQWLVTKSKAASTWLVAYSKREWSQYMEWRQNMAENASKKAAEPAPEKPPVAIVMPKPVKAKEKRKVEDKPPQDVPASLKEKAKSALEVIKPAERKKAPEPKKAVAPLGEQALPALELLEDREIESASLFDQSSLEEMSELLVVKLLEFGVKAEVVSAAPGPVVTRFEINPEAGIKVSKISGLAKDLARSLSVMSVRVVEVIPGKPYVGIEVPNPDRQMVSFRDVIGSEEFANAKSPLSIALGHDIAGQPVVADIAKMPHLLVAGTTGSGKSVGVNSMLLSLLYKSTPEQLRLLLVDPKMLELSVYEGIPHLIAPVVTDMKDAANGLRWCVNEMERRYQLLAKVGVRQLKSFNEKVEAARDAGEPLLDPLWEPEPGDVEANRPELETLPAIVVVVDEFADMMMTVGKKVEELIARIAQKARAAGIHLILATQRPSVDVITGLIKANVPTRIGFQVSSKIDSRTILDQGGAEQLLGNGDMLFLPPGTSVTHRVHGAFVSDDEVHRVAEDWKSKGEPNYIEGVLEEPSASIDGGIGDDPEENDLFAKAVEHVLETKKCSISGIQRKLKVGYNRSSRFVEQMEEMGIVGPPNGNGVREIIRQ